MSQRPASSDATENQLDDTFFALASAARRRILDLLKRESGCNVNHVCAAFDGEIGRFAVMKHLAVLERGGLLITQREGRDKRLWLDPTPLQLIHERWTTEFSAYWSARLTQLKYRAEGAEVLKLPKHRKERRHG
ncbi:MAG: ArsR family transcriptional regulator [Pseudomonadota bacterium]|nr:ArsR family transcriptional regulator [Pseudomonadota bacterium]